MSIGKTIVMNLGFDTPHIHGYIWGLGRRHGANKYMDRSVRDSQVTNFLVVHPLKTDVPFILTLIAQNVFWNLKSQGLLN
jgi:hypothetical protein